MTELNWTVRYTENGEERTLSGKSPLKLGENHIRAFLPACEIKSVVGKIKVTTVLREKLFMNGYQT